MICKKVTFYSEEGKHVDIYGVEFCPRSHTSALNKHGRIKFSATKAYLRIPDQAIDLLKGFHPQYASMTNERGLNMHHRISPNWNGDLKQIPVC